MEVGLHVYIRLVSTRYYSSPDGNTHVESPYAQRSHGGPGALSGWFYVGLTSCPSRPLLCSQWEVVPRPLPRYYSSRITVPRLGRHPILLPSRQQGPQNAGVLGR